MENVHKKSKETELPRSDYPRPQFERKEWLNLNGEWEFCFDDANTGEQDGLQYANTSYTHKIIVPFAFQSKLSGIGDTGFHDIVWYRRTLRVPASWKSKIIKLHFGAVDYIAKVWINGHLVAMHEGGHTPFEVDISHYVKEDAENVLVVRAQDFSKDLTLPRGKQFWQEKSASIFYTRTTGIWQSVWLEPVNDVHLRKVKMTPDIDRNEIQITSYVEGIHNGETVELATTIYFEGELIASNVQLVKQESETRSIGLNDFPEHGFGRLWSPEKPNLYDIKFQLLRAGEVIDEVSSYFGMRKISVENGKFCLNNKPYYQRLVLDQGYFPDGILTPPSDEALKQDVDLIKALGFNGVRKHQKTEDPRFLYWCDKIGLLLWSEAANAYAYSQEYVRRFTKEWQEIMDRDYNHPCIAVWVPLNESWGIPNVQHDSCQQHHGLTMYHLTKSLDQSRPVVYNDGWEQITTDLLTIHDYESQQEVLEERYASIESTVSAMPANKRIFVGEGKYEGQPILISEFGGIAFKKSDWEGWGYSGADNEEEFLAHLKAILDPMYSSPIIQGFCYTQLTDVEQEINGLLTYDRVVKAPIETIRSIIAGKHMS